MTQNKTGSYRFPPCVVCKERADAGLQGAVRAGRCYIRGVGDLCSQHFHMIEGARSRE